MILQVGTPIYKPRSDPTPGLGAETLQFAHRRTCVQSKKLLPAPIRGLAQLNWWCFKSKIRKYRNIRNGYSSNNPWKQGMSTNIIHTRNFLKNRCCRCLFLVFFCNVFFIDGRDVLWENQLHVFLMGIDGYPCQCHPPSREIRSH